MQTAVALLRGINVGGKNSLPMRQLVGMLEGLGAMSVQTYIQSGNAVFQCTANRYQNIQQHLAETIRETTGLKIQVLVMQASQFLQRVDANPFADMPDTPAALHMGFLAANPAHLDNEKLAALKSDREQYQLSHDAFYLYAPDGIGKSKLAAGAEKALGVAMTMRNWKTVCAMRDMLQQMT